MDTLIKLMLENPTPEIESELAQLEGQALFSPRTKDIWAAKYQKFREYETRPLGLRISSSGNVLITDDRKYTPPHKCLTKIRNQ